MLERDVIQVRGFHNLYENGARNEATGFQVCVKSTYYRGVWLSMLRMGTLKVDGEEMQDVTFSFDRGKTYYTKEQMLSIADEQWYTADPCIIKVKKPGGLATGYHDVAFDYRYIMSYIPPIVNSDEAFARIPPRVYQKTLIIV